MKSLPEDLLSLLHVNEVDADELRYLLMTCIPGGVLHYGGQQDVLYGAGGENDFALRVRHDLATDAILAIEPGPGLTETLQEDLRRRIETDLIESTNPKVGREILLSESPLDGYSRYANILQLLPVPPEAPIAVWAPGVSARHPLLLEVQFPGSANPATNNFRRLKAARDFELTLNALLRGSIRSAMGNGRFHWVTSQPKTSGDPQPPSDLLREGYGWPGMQNELDEFTALSQIEPISQLDPAEYYATEPWGPNKTLLLPSDLTAQLDRFNRLLQENRQCWRRASYWFQHSSVVRSYSYSAAFAALVISIESLIPEDTQNHRKTERFEEFVDRHLTTRNLPKDRVKEFHDIRSQFLHGNELHYFDNNPLWIGWTPTMQQSLEDFNQMRQVARHVLVEWLART